MGCDGGDGRCVHAVDHVDVDGHVDADEVGSSFFNVVRWAFHEMWGTSVSVVRGDAVIDEVWDALSGLPGGVGMADFGFLMSVPYRDIRPDFEELASAAELFLTPLDVMRHGLPRNGLYRLARHTDVFEFHHVAPGMMLRFVEEFGRLPDDVGDQFVREALSSVVRMHDLGTRGLGGPSRFRFDYRSDRLGLVAGFPDFPALVRLDGALAWLETEHLGRARLGLGAKVVRPLLESALEDGDAWPVHVLLAVIDRLRGIVNQALAAEGMETDRPKYMSTAQERRRASVVRSALRPFVPLQAGSLSVERMRESRGAGVPPELVAEDLLDDGPGDLYKRAGGVRDALDDLFRMTDTDDGVVELHAMGRLHGVGTPVPCRFEECMSMMDCAGSPPAAPGPTGTPALCESLIRDGERVMSLYRDPVAGREATRLLVEYRPWTLLSASMRPRAALTVLADAMDAGVPGLRRLCAYLANQHLFPVLAHAVADGDPDGLLPYRPAVCDRRDDGRDGHLVPKASGLPVLSPVKRRHGDGVDPSAIAAGWRAGRPSGMDAWRDRWLHPYINATATGSPYTDQLHEWVVGGVPMTMVGVQAVRVESLGPFTSPPAIGPAADRYRVEVPIEPDADSPMRPLYDAIWAVDGA